MTGTVAIHTAGGAAVGGGHLSRSRSLARALVGEVGSTVEVVAEAPAHLAAAVAAPGVGVDLAADRDGARRALAGRASAGSRVLVTDLPGLGSEDARWAREVGFEVLVHLCDDGADTYGGDLFVNGDVAPPAGLRPSARRSLVGPEYHVVRPEVVALRPRRPWARDRVDRVLLSVGAADPGRLTEAVLPDLVALRVDVVVVVGPAVDRERADELIRAGRSGVEVHVGPPDLAPLIAAADLVVTLPGLTAYEALCLGRPVACLAWGHLAPYARVLAREGCAAVLEAEEPLALDGAGIGDLVDTVGEHRLRAATGHRVVDGGGAARVARAIAEEAA